MRDDVLFYEYDWSGVERAQIAAAQQVAAKVSASEFGSAEVSEIAAKICNDYSLEIPVLDTENITVKQREVQIDVSRDVRRNPFGDGPSHVQGTAIDVRVPFTGDPNMFKIKPNTWTTSIPRGRVEGNSLVFTISGTSLSKETVKSEIDQRIAELQTWLGFQEKSLGNFPEELKRSVDRSLAARKAKLEADADLISGLGYKTE